MNADATPTIGWAAVCFLPVLLLGVSAVILLVVLLRKRSRRPRRRTIERWSNPGGVWWFVVPGVVIVAVVVVTLFRLSAGTTATWNPNSHIVNGEEMRVEPAEPFDRAMSVVVFAVVAGVVAIGVFGLLAVGVVRLFWKPTKPPVALPVAPLILTPDPTPETTPTADPNAPLPFNPGPWMTRGELLGVVASVVLCLVLPWAGLMYTGTTLDRENEVAVALLCLLPFGFGLFSVYTLWSERRRRPNDGYDMHVKVRARMGLPPAMTRAEFRAKLEAELRKNATQPTVEPPLEGQDGGGVGVVQKNAAQPTVEVPPSLIDWRQGISFWGAVRSKQGVVFLLIALGLGVAVGIYDGTVWTGVIVGCTAGFLLFSYHLGSLRRQAIVNAYQRMHAAQPTVEPPSPPPPPSPPVTPKQPPPVPGEDYAVTLARHRLSQGMVMVVLVAMMGGVLAGILALVSYGKTSTPDDMIVPVMVSLFAALFVLPLISAAVIYTGHWAIRRWVYPLPKGVPPAAAVPLFATPPTAGDCPTCLSPIPADSPHGLCPRCLIRGAMPSPSSTRLRRGVSPIEPPTAAQVNEFFPHLEVLELIGAGGMGAVYTARQPALDRVVALKIVQSPRGDEDPVFAERFAREARAMAKLDHPNIVTIHESGEAGGLPFLLMEFVDGITLREAMVNRLLTTTEALAVIPQVCDALDFAHRAGVVHRDIKPENILIDQTGRVKIADFGLAKLADPKNVTLTRTQQAMGTPHYMAPEQWERPNEVDHRADIYALGVVLYELLTGELPLGRFALPSEKGKGDAKLDQVVVKALAKDVGERFQTAGQMKAALSGVNLAGFTPAVPPKRTGFEFRSKAKFLGLPLVHVVSGSDPLTGKKRVAKGWIAVGDVSAVGGIAVGGVAGIGVIGVGGVTGIGVVGIGGAAGVGLVALGAVAAGVIAAVGGSALSFGVSVGGLALGRFAVGGDATGEYVMSKKTQTPGFADALWTWSRSLWPW